MDIYLQVHKCYLFFIFSTGITTNNNEYAEIPEVVAIIVEFLIYSWQISYIP